jgi:DNA-binding HxlR family transcriptional regulator
MPQLHSQRMHAFGFHSLFAMATSVDNLVSICNYIWMRDHFEGENCSVARALEVLGDGWALLVIREAFFGTRRFADFEANLAISKNVLTQRLAHLVERGVLERVTRYEYVLTPMGKDLATVLTTLRQWGDRWITGAGNEPLLVYDRRTQRPIPRVRIRGEDGEALGAREIELRPGPGATPETLARFARAKK